MGVIIDAISGLIGPSSAAIERTAQIFRPNAEAQARRDAQMQNASLQQFAAEFAHPSSGFDRFIDGLNRLPRPLLAFSTLGFFAAAMINPIWFAERMQGLALVPEPLWWLLGAIVSFYFGARHQAKGFEIQKSLAAVQHVKSSTTNKAEQSANPALAELRQKITN